MEANKDFQYIEEYYDKLKELQKEDYILESIQLVEDMGKLIKFFFLIYYLKNQKFLMGN